MFSLVAFPLGTAPGSVNIVRRWELIARKARPCKQCNTVMQAHVMVTNSHLEYNPIDKSIVGVAMIIQNNKHYNIPEYQKDNKIKLTVILNLLCVQNEHPGEESTEHSTNILDAPDSSLPAPVVCLVKVMNVVRYLHGHVHLHIALLVPSKLHPCLLL